MKFKSFVVNNEMKVNSKKSNFKNYANIKNKSKSKIIRKSITLLEIMIVIFLIGIIASVIGYNMKGSLEEGKAFKTVRAKEQVRDILLLEVAKGRDISDVVNHAEEILKESGLVKDPTKLLIDGWGKRLDISVIGNDDIFVVSTNLNEYEAKKTAKAKTNERSKQSEP